MHIVVSFFPVLVFLVLLNFFDSYKLVKPRSVLFAIVIGFVAAFLSFLVNTVLMNMFTSETRAYSLFGAPVVEELLKASYLAYLIYSKRVGFMVDAAIYGFAIGSGFACVENVYYLHELGTTNILLWVIRGFGTAVMHGGTTAIFGIVSKNISDRYSQKRFLAFLPGVATTIIVHSLFNLFFLPPIIETLLTIVLLPLLLFLVFKRSEQSTRVWLGSGLDADMEILHSMMITDLSETNIGKYLHTLRERFPAEVIVDMLCLLRIHTELAIRSKGILMMREAGFKSQPDADTVEKFAELRFLEESIGKTGKMAIAPFLHTASRDLWQIYMLEN